MFLIFTLQKEYLKFMSIEPINIFHTNLSKSKQIIEIQNLTLRVYKYYFLKFMDLNIKTIKIQNIDEFYIWDDARFNRDK